MRKIYLFILVFISIRSYSQNALPNPGFENWTSQGTYDTPDNWQTLNATTFAFGVLTAQKASGADVHSGTLAIKLLTQTVLTNNANGLATTGTINISSQTISGGISYTLRPDSITGWYKYSPVAADIGFVDFSLLDASGNDTIGFAEFLTPNAVINSYTYFSAAITYRNSNTPALSRCVLSSSNGFSAVVGSAMFIDDLGLVFNQSGIRTPVSGRNIVSFNNSNKILDVVSQTHSMITVIDITGKTIFKNRTEQGVSQFNIPTLTTGLYIYTLTDDQMKVLSSGKFIVQ